MHQLFCLRNVLIVVLLSSACGGAQSRPGERLPTGTNPLWLPDGAIIESGPEAPTSRDQLITFRIAVPQAEQLTARLIDHFTRERWHARYATPLVAASFRNGWLKGGGGIQQPRQDGVPRLVDFREWWGDWENRAGDCVEYRLFAVRFEAQRLTDIHGSGRLILSKRLWKRILQRLR